ncbi:MAG: autotransporter domain-containing protein [Pseudolabrys sp.]|nr:autotransporter domain-containing protein [Pseudolabrys sp.]
MRRMRGVALLLSSTALASLVLTHAATGREALPPLPAAIKAKPAKKAASLSAEIDKAIRASALAGKNGLIAGLFDTVQKAPEQRTAALHLATTLAPEHKRDLITAADLGVLLNGQRLVLAPNAAQVMAGQSGAAAAPVSAPVYAPLANNPSPNLPNPLPHVNDQTWNRTMIGAGVAHGLGFTGAGVTVAVGDSGFDINNAALVNRLDLTRAKNYIINNANTAYDPAFVGLQSNTDIHGSHVSGIIAAEKFDNVDMYGIAHNARIVPIRVILAGPPAPNAEYADEVIEPTRDALNYFTSLNNVMVYNASYGPSLPNGTPPQSVWTLRNTTAEYGAALGALQAGKIIVAAAGNSREAHPTAARNPAGLALMPFINPSHNNLGVYTDGGNNLDFSALQNQSGQIISVMAVAASKRAATYSNLCGVTASWCVAAPGGDTPFDRGVYSTVPLNTYGFTEGTSMAAPAVSGAIAVLISAFPTYTAQDLAHLLFSTTEDLGAPGIDGVFGHGLIRLDRAVAGPTSLAAGAAVNVAQDTTTYWSKPLITSGAFSKTGEGILTISGKTFADGNVSVADGTLAVDGSLLLGANRLTIDAPGTLAGFGTVTGNTTINGTLSPGQMGNIADLIANNVAPPGSELTGNSIGILTFKGNVSLAATATTRIDIDGNLQTNGGPGTFDRIVVSGADNVFTANGALTPILTDSVGTVSGYIPAIGTSFAFVQATDGARTAGAFSSLLQPVASLPANGRFDVIYKPTSITLAVTPSSFAGVTGGNAGNGATAVAGIIDANRPAPGAMPSASLKQLYDALYALNAPSQFSTAVSQLSAPGQTAITSGSMGAFQGFMGSISERQDALTSGTQVAQDGTAQSASLAYGGKDVSAVASQAASAFAGVDAAPPAASGWSVWGQGFGRWSSVGNTATQPGSTSTGGGFTVGADTTLANDLVGGVAFGYARTASHSAGTRATSDSYTGALYASWTPGNAVFDLRAAAGPSNIRTSRDVLLAPSAIQGETNGVGAGVSVEGGYRIRMGDVVVKPFAGLAWQGFRRDGYTESQQPIGLVFPSQYFEKVTSTLGVALSQTTRFGNGATLMPEFKLGWGHDWRDTTLVSQAALLDSSFTTNGAEPGRDAALVGFKLSGWTQSNFRLFTAYNSEFRSNAWSHQLSGGARYTW